MLSEERIKEVAFETCAAFGGNPDMVINFARAIEAEAQKVPDRIEKVGPGFKGLFAKEAAAYKMGWNDCRAAMLAAAPQPDHIGEADKMVEPVQQWKSFAQWPAHMTCVSPYQDCISTDTHTTKEQAEGVCWGLEREGFGGERKVFPLRTWVEPAQKEAKPEKHQFSCICDECCAQQEKVQEPVAFSDRYRVVRTGFWWRVRIGDSQKTVGRCYTETEAQRLASALQTAFYDGEFIGQSLAPPNAQQLKDEAVCIGEVPDHVIKSDPLYQKGRNEAQQEPVAAQRSLLEMIRDGQDAYAQQLRDEALEDAARWLVNRGIIVEGSNVWDDFRAMKGE